MVAPPGHGNRRVRTMADGKTIIDTGDADGNFGREWYHADRSVME